MKVQVLMDDSMRDIGYHIHHLADLKNATSRAFTSNEFNGTGLTSAIEQFLELELWPAS